MGLFLFAQAEAGRRALARDCRSDAGANNTNCIPRNSTYSTPAVARAAMVVQLAVETNAHSPSSWDRRFSGRGSSYFSAR